MITYVRRDLGLFLINVALILSNSRHFLSLYHCIFSDCPLGLAQDSHIRSKGFLHCEVGSRLPVVRYLLHLFPSRLPSPVDVPVSDPRSTHVARGSLVLHGHRPHVSVVASKSISTLIPSVPDLVGQRTSGVVLQTRNTVSFS